jgi:hypothetical protein
MFASRAVITVAKSQHHRLAEVVPEVDREGVRIVHTARVACRETHRSRADDHGADHLRQHAARLAIRRWAILSGDIPAHWRSRVIVLRSAGLPAIIRNVSWPYIPDDRAAAESDARARARALRSTKPVWKRARQERTVVLSIELQAAVQRCRQVAQSVGTERTPTQASSDVIEVVTPETARSSGIVLRLALVSSTPSDTTVSISAWPGGQLTDWGESRRLVDFVASQLTSGRDGSE